MLVISNLFATRHLSRLLYQLVPAALVTSVGVLLLSNLAKVADAPQAAPVETAINAEAVFRIVPREPVVEASRTRSVRKPRPRARPPIRSLPPARRKRAKP